MATPLADLLNGLRTDIELRGEFVDAPREFLDAHGWATLDVADLREACYILADGSPPDDAAHWLTSGHALDTPDEDPATALLVALEAVAPVAFDLDPAAMDGIDADESADDRIDDTPDDTPDDTDTDTDAHGVTDTWLDDETGNDETGNDETGNDETGNDETWHDDSGESPVIDDGADLEPDAGLDTRDAGDFGDDWDEII